MLLFALGHRLIALEAFGGVARFANMDIAAHEWVGLVAYRSLDLTPTLFPAPRCEPQAARASRLELATNTVSRFENGFGVMVDTLMRIQSALEDAGVIFIAADQAAGVFDFAKVRLHHEAFMRSSSGLQRQRMVEERAIQRHKLQILDLALREKHSVEWVAGHRLGCDGGQRVVLVDRHDLYTQTIQ